MANGSMRFYYVYMENNTDSRDDEVWKIRARTKDRAKRLAEQDSRSFRFAVRQVFTQKGIKRYDPYWHTLLWGCPPIIDEARTPCV